MFETSSREARKLIHVHTCSADANQALALVVAQEAAQTLSRLRRVRGTHRRTARRIAEASAVLAAALVLAGLPPLASPAPALTPVFVNLGDGQLFVGYGGTADFVDIDGDGDFDAFIGNAEGDTIFFRNTGTVYAPTFAPPATNPFGLNYLAGGFWLELADIDGDGDLDAFIGNAGGDTIFFQNTGSAVLPAFAASSANPFGLSNVGGWASPDLADIDEDGDLDAFVANYYGDTVFFENTGTATVPAFTGPVTNPLGLANVGYGASPSLVDLDGDGDLDALIGERYGNTILFQNTGTATMPAFAAPVTNPFGLANVGDSAWPALVDIDGDGDLDVFFVVGGGNDNHSLFFQNTGTASAPAFALPATDPFTLSAYRNYATLKLTDIDGDGDLDAFLGESYGNALFFENTGTASAPAFKPPATNPFGLSHVSNGYTSPDLVDIDGDGDVDAFVGEASGNTIFFPNTGSAVSPAFAAPVTNPFGLSNVGSEASPDLVDIDADGDFDAFIGEQDGNTVFFENTGMGSVPTFAVPASNPFGLSDVGYSASPEFADIDGDGDLDALIGDTDWDTIFFENTGAANSPAFAAPVTNPYGLNNIGWYVAGPVGRASPELVDIDGDGDLDAFIGDVYGRVFVFRNDAIPPVTPTNTATPSGTPTPTSSTTSLVTPTSTNTPTSPTCPLTPTSGCATSIGGQLRIVDHPTDDRDRLKWAFKGGPALNQGDFGDPTTATSHALCVYDDGVLKLQAQVPPSSSLWLPVSTKGYKYKDPLGGSDGITKMRLLGGTADRSKLRAIGKGANLPLPAPASPTRLLNATAEVKAQLLDSQGKCYETTFTPTDVQRNDGTLFKARF